MGHAARWAVPSSAGTSHPLGTLAEGGTLWRQPMSRYQIPAQDPRFEVVVGWDSPLPRFFVKFSTPPRTKTATRPACSGKGWRSSPFSRWMHCTRISARLPRSLRQSVRSSGAIRNMPRHAVHCRTKCSAWCSHTVRFADPVLRADPKTAP